MADKTEKKPGFVARMKAAVKGFAANVAKFFRDTKSELKKVVWPSKADIKTNTVVVLVTFMAACLSFVVVFTLSNTNISERERELATIKVLGFRRGEVHHYVNKETLILTAIGAALGVPLGGLLAKSFTYILQMPSLYFDVEVEPLSYVLAVVLSFGFTFIVNLATNRTLNKIDMVGALKSAE